VLAVLGAAVGKIDGETIAELTRLHAGNIVFEDREIGLSPATIARGEINGYIRPAIFSLADRRENLLIAARRGDKFDSVYELFPISRRGARRRREISGGEQQMLRIGRALMGNRGFTWMNLWKAWRR
jgi:ABC-type branched-subunit amino acid transport system ATPase component